MSSEAREIGKALGDIAVELVKAGKSISEKRIAALESALAAEAKRREEAEEEQRVLGNRLEDIEKRLSTTQQDLIDNVEENYLLRADNARLREALGRFLTMYLRLANSGDCGFWDPEKEPEVIAARAALAPQGKEKYCGNFGATLITDTLEEQPDMGEPIDDSDVRALERARGFKP